jgi:hypothetical protein
MVVPLSSRDVERYRAEPNLLGSFREHVDLERREIDNHDRNCPMLNREKLCQLHAENGHRALPLACRLYPRQMALFGSELRAWLLPSCPEVINLLFSEQSEQLVGVGAARSMPRKRMQHTPIQIHERHLPEPQYTMWKQLKAAYLSSDSLYEYLTLQHQYFEYLERGSFKYEPVEAQQEYQEFILEALIFGNLASLKPSASPQFQELCDHVVAFIEDKEGSMEAGCLQLQARWRELPREDQASIERFCRSLCELFHFSGFRADPHAQQRELLFEQLWLSLYMLLCLSSPSYLSIEHWKSSASLLGRALNRYVLKDKQVLLSIGFKAHQAWVSFLLLFWQR